MSDATIMLKFEDGTAFRWTIPEKYGWKLFFEKWKGSIINDFPAKEKNVKSSKKGRAKEDDEFRLD